jgi:hypothetical protein
VLGPDVCWLAVVKALDGKIINDLTTKEKGKDPKRKNPKGKSIHPAPWSWMDTR